MWFEYNFDDIDISNYLIKSKVTGKVKQFIGYVDTRYRTIYECELYKKEGYNDLVPVIVKEYRFVPDIYKIIDIIPIWNVSNNVYRNLVYSLNEYENRWSETGATEEQFSVFHNIPWKKVCFKKLELF